ncbi:MAG: hypothetical protein HY746_04000 [Elusimicrobia bacterium]|nr:hypothetical protein [Elusimicrobiota bacterium]
MTKKKLFINFLLVLAFIYPCAADDGLLSSSTGTPVAGSDISASTESAVFPKLLWEKKLSKPITSSAISKDGTKIAIADETGYLTLYDTKGKKLWAYRYYGELPKRTLEFQSDKSDTIFFDVKFSGGGKYIIADLRVLNTWTDFRGFGKTEEYEPYIKIFLDKDGKLLWQTLKEGRHFIGGDEYVLIQSWSGDESDTNPLDYYLLDTRGQLLFTGKTNGDSLRCYGFSEDGRYLFLDNKIIECKSGRSVWEIKSGLFEGINKNHAVVVNKGGGEVYNFTTRTKLLNIRNTSFFSITNKHIAGIQSEQGKVFLTVHEIETGRLVWRRQSYPEPTPGGDERLLYLTKDSMRLFLGGVKSLILYNSHGGEIWRLPVIIKPNGNFDYYSLTENGEFVLFGYDRAVRLYKSF